MLRWSGITVIFIDSGPPEDFNFDGYVEIYLICNKATDKMYLHLNELEIDNSTIMFRAVDDNDTPPGEYWINSWITFLRVCLFCGQYKETYFNFYYAIKQA